MNGICDAYVRFTASRIINVRISVRAISFPSITLTDRDDIIALFQLYFQVRLDEIN